MTTHKWIIALVTFAIFSGGSAHAQEPELSPINTTLTEVELQLIEWVATQQADLVAELKTHVNINTGTENISGLNTYRRLLEQNFKELGFGTRTVSSSPLSILTCSGGQFEFADHLVAQRTGDGPKLLLNGHMDTVFSANDVFQSMVVAESGVIKGPGVGDMKGGIVVMLNALRALNTAGLLENTNLTVLLNSDEEIGSLGSRALIEDLAAQHDLGLVFEGSSNNELTRARKGLGQARIKVTGREAHAGAAHQDGVSASLELAHKIIDLEALTDYPSKSTVNVGVLAGGEKRNTIPGCAEAYVDLRFATADHGAALKANVEDIATHTYTPSVQHSGFPKSEATVMLHRPVKSQHPEVDKLIQQAMGLSALIGEPITGTRYSGGGTDGSIAQAAGLPTADSMGVNGSGAHSSREQTTVASLLARTQLAAVMLYRLSRPQAQLQSE